MYDHVLSPTTVNPDGIKAVGLAKNEPLVISRVPVIVVSPFAKAHVSHTVIDHTAILRLI